ncbi:immunoglobulin-like domain-containing protein [Fodinibius salsisoli]|uniref:Bacterial Ig-like domain-containing protein n=1 Tax=Fodinibius salsisoli TaxID=2820877 RepID=A0ABT3PHZ1_9BACT|nr:immunoglobulin-like domain-containing protein [Fodinibius salsisoli]MCW9705544.1 hypothetical protein [Fodinibius salsisoli]
MSKGSACLGICSILLGILALAGCEVTDVPEGGPLNVSFKVEKSNYEIGSSIKTILKNGSGLRITYNPCSSTLVHKNEESWQEMDSFLLCTYDLKSLAPGDSASYHIDLTDNMNLPEGVYKVRTNIEAQEEKTIATQSFKVTVN